MGGGGEMGGNDDGAYSWKHRELIKRMGEGGGEHSHWQRLDCGALLLTSYRFPLMSRC